MGTRKEPSRKSDAERAAIRAASKEAARAEKAERDKAARKAASPAAIKKAEREAAQEARDREANQSSQPKTKERFNCPKCGSTNTSKVSVVHAQGTSTSSGRSSSVHVGLLGGGMVPVVGQSTSKGKSQTVLARSLAPPSPGLGASGVLGIFGLVIGLGVWWFFLNDSGMACFVAPFVGMIAGVGVGVAVKGKEEMAVNDYARHRWESEWICMRCGQKFTPR